MRLLLQIWMKIVGTMELLVVDQGLDFAGAEFAGHFWKQGVRQNGATERAGRAFKEMLDTTYYPLLGQIEGRPYGSIISAGSDGEGAQRQLDRILTGWRLRRVCNPHIVVTGAQTANEIMSEKIPKASDLKVARDMGESFKQGLSLGVF